MFLFQHLAFSKSCWYNVTRLGVSRYKINAEVALTKLHGGIRLLCLTHLPMTSYVPAISVEKACHD